VDKKLLLSPNLSLIMANFTNPIDELTQLHTFVQKSSKADGSPVTPLDLALSVLLENMSQQHFPGATFYSEEKYSSWDFPLMVVDPLDGTREYIRHRPEWAVSVGFFENQNFKGEGWVYNPCSKELFNSQLPLFSYADKSKYCGEVSHSEWDKGLYRLFKSEKFSLQPMGSIAYKLGRLAAGKIDFVISLTPKSIWDIAGGTLLCHQSKMKFYSEGKEVTEVKPRYLPPLIWCHEELFEELSSLV
jgi:myo-inositol-1(or 4)-monophosphatase